MLFRQFFDGVSSTYTYLLASAPGREAVLIDPVKEQVEQYLTAIGQLGLRLVKAIDTHTHADHITALGDLRDQTRCISIMGEYTQADCVSYRVSDGEILDTDGIRLRALYTPGHTNESFSFVLAPEAPRAVFSGDVLMIRGTGRTDFQNGDPGKSWDSITQTLFALPDETALYPAHDYKGWTSSSIGEERRYNPRLAGKTREQYIEIMNNLKLPNPKMMDVAIPANLGCGLDAPQGKRG
ncbi:MBL fold metallo-hydrolase [Candidimonas nitroreducens]|uniref:Zn-dependent hydrolase n=1 Tax=Candidimonas nitroreducens TaxID=683354 RepID=A0A225LYC3_9BURK|nr:MBL fold metallo-hydrolase [Candidimonas nitroreducens]OWT54187.1 Zn-dependent hydrolase [Candidimonas nitroreducens]